MDTEGQLYMFIASGSLSLLCFSQVQLSMAKLLLKRLFQSMLPLAMYTITFKCIYTLVTKT